MRWPRKPVPPRTRILPSSVDMHASEGFGCDRERSSRGSRQTRRRWGAHPRAAHPYHDCGGLGLLLRGVHRQLVSAVLGQAGPRGLPFYKYERRKFPLTEAPGISVFCKTRKRSSTGTRVTAVGYPRVATKLTCRIRQTF